MFNLLFRVSSIFQDGPNCLRKRALVCHHLLEGGAFEVCFRQTLAQLRKAEK